MGPRTQGRSRARCARAHLDEPPFVEEPDRFGSANDRRRILPAIQDEKLLEIAAIQDDLTPAIRAALAPAERDYVDRLLGETPRAITLRDLPRSFTVLGLRERDGSVDKVVLVYPRPSSALWDANAMESFVGSLRKLARDSTTGPRAPRLAGSLPLSADIVEAVRHDGPIASIAALAGVVVTVLLLLREGRSSGLVVGALVVGVLWMAGFSHLLGVRVNFANFIAFPITFGIGVDYAVNVVSRYKHDGSGDILGAVRSTGAAVALCSLTTIIGYSSLLMAQNRALFLFGLLAVMGEVACLSVALVSLPALLLLVQTSAFSEPSAAPARGPPSRWASRERQRSRIGRRVPTFGRARWRPR